MQHPVTPSRCILIVTGCPGAGKTSVSARLAAADPRGLHLASDVFYGFPAHPVDPTTPESQAQNDAIVRAVMRAAAAFAEAGYEVVVDGIFGPWWLPQIADELQRHGLTADYALLRADLDEALRRATTRVHAADPEAVRHMHRSFAAAEPCERHALETTGVPLDEVVRSLQERRANGALRLDLAALAHAGHR
jgi:predicted kinase